MNYIKKLYNSIKNFIQYVLDYNKPLNKTYTIDVVYNQRNILTLKNQFQIDPYQFKDYRGNQQELEKLMIDDAAIEIMREAQKRGLIRIEQYHNQINNNQVYEVRIDFVE